MALSVLQEGKTEIVTFLLKLYIIYCCSPWRRSYCELDSIYFFGKTGTNLMELETSPDSSSKQLPCPEPKIKYCGLRKSELSSPSREVLCYFCPAVTQLLVKLIDKPVLILRPGGLLDVRIEMVVPPLPTLLPSTTFEVFRNQSPAFGSILLDQLKYLFVFLEIHKRNPITNRFSPQD